MPAQLDTACTTAHLVTLACRWPQQPNAWTCWLGCRIGLLPGLSRCGVLQHPDPDGGKASSPSQTAPDPSELANMASDVQCAPLCPTEPSALQVKKDLSRRQEPSQLLSQSCGRQKVLQVLPQRAAANKRRLQMWSE